MTDYTSTGMGDEGAFGATCSDSTMRSQLFSHLRFAWGLIPGVPAKSDTGAEPTDIILRYVLSFENLRLKYASVVIFQAGCTQCNLLVSLQCIWAFIFEVSLILSWVLTKNLSSPWGRCRY